MEVVTSPDAGAPLRAAASEVVAPTGRQTLLIAAGQAALMGFGGLLALLIAQSFGKTTDTDAYFAAYGVYTVGLVFAGTFRLTAIAGLVRSEGPRTATLMLGAVGFMLLVAGIPMLVGAVPVGRLLIEHDPGGEAPVALRILWLALAGQLLAALLATIMSVRGQFTALGVVTLLTGAVNIATFLLVRGPLGIEAASVALVAGAVWISGGCWIALWRAGWRPERLHRALLPGIVAESGKLLYASATFVGVNAAYLVSLALATRQGAGEATLYSYAYALASILVAVTANVSAMTRAPSLAADAASRTVETARVGVRSFRFTLLLGGPALGLALLVGPPFITVALGSAYDGDDVRSILITVACMTGWVLGSAAGVFGQVELLAQERLRELAYVAIAHVLGTAALAALGAALAGAAGVAAGLSVAALAVAAVQLRLAYGGHAGRALGDMGGDLLREVALLAVCFAPAVAVLLALGPGLAGYAAAGLIAGLLTLVASAKAWPEEAAMLRGALGR